MTNTLFRFSGADTENVEVLCESGYAERTTFALLGLYFARRAKGEPPDDALLYCIHRIAEYVGSVER